MTRITALALALLVAAAPALAADKAQVRSRPNSLGGETYYLSTSKHPIQCRPNSQGGQTCHAI